MATACAGRAAAGLIPVNLGRACPRSRERRGNRVATPPKGGRRRLWWGAAPSSNGAETAGAMAPAVAAPGAYFVTTSAPFIMLEWPGKEQ